MPFTWTEDTEPFTDLRDHTPARFVLEQVEDANFSLRRSFRYQPAGTDPIDVTPTALPRTDLASIPSFMSWFVSRYGRHTAAALVHDRLYQEVERVPVERAAADRVFLHAMDALDVPPVRSRVMWAGVAAATRWITTPWGRVGIIAWGLAAAAGTGLLVYGFVSLTWWAVVVALAAPALGALLWGRRAYPAGLIGGYAVLFVVVPALASWIGWLSYWVAEQLVRLGRKLLPHNRGKPLPRPVSYKEA